MNNKTILYSLLSIISGFSHAEIPDPPFHRGVNLAGWFQYINNASAVQFTRFTRKDFENIKSLGCDHIRLPLELSGVTGPAPDHTIDPLFFTFLDQVIGWAEDLNLHLILDNHSFDPSVATSQELLDSLIPIWTQIAGRYKNRSRLIYYEILNEPHDISDTKWNTVQQQVISAVRAVDSVHTIVVGPAEWNGYTHLKNMPVYADTNLIYTFHFYDPFLFTHQGASWTDPSMEHISGIPYPYNALTMPDLPTEYKGNWIGNDYQRYSQEGNNAFIDSRINIAVQFGEDRHVPLWCGEFGAYVPNSSTEDRARWHETVRSILEDHHMAWSLWEYSEDFGIFKPGTSGLFESDVNIPIIEALGLVSPPQQEYALKPDSIGFVIYDDYTGNHIKMSNWLGSAIVNFYSTDDPAAGEFCITWTDADQYDALSFQFKPVKDLTHLVSEDYWLNIRIRGSSAETRIDLRFMDTDTDEPSDHPWRMRTVIDDRELDWDGSWQQVRIPLKNFEEHGAWETDTWYDPQDDFDWSQVGNFDIVAEYHDLKGIELAFDDIKIVGLSDPTNTPSSHDIITETIELHPAFPNPFNVHIILSFSIPEKQKIRMDIYNLSGQRIQTLINDELEKGFHRAMWDGTGFPSGIYVVRLKTESCYKAGRMILMK